MNEIITFRDRKGKVFHGTVKMATANGETLLLKCIETGRPVQINKKQIVENKD